MAIRARARPRDHLAVHRAGERVDAPARLAGVDQQQDALAPMRLTASRNGLPRCCLDQRRLVAISASAGGSTTLSMISPCPAR